MKFNFLIGVVFGFILFAAVVLLVLPISVWGIDREWVIFQETRRKGIDVMHTGVAPDSALTARNSKAFKRLVAAGEIVAVDVPAEHIEEVLGWMGRNGIDWRPPLTVLMGGQNRPGRLYVPRSAQKSLETFAKSLL